MTIDSRQIAAGMLAGVPFVLATVRPGRPADEVAAELAAGTRPEFPVPVEISTEDAVTTAQLTVVWTLRPH